MLHKKPINGRINFVFLLILFSILACKNEESLVFTSKEYVSSELAEIELVYPQIETSNSITNVINKGILNHVINALNLSEEPQKAMTIKEAIKEFNSEYSRFKSDFPDSSQQWYASVEGEVTYQSPEIISIVMSSYLDTGGAHGNDNITFLNFNTQTGSILKIDDLLELSSALNTLVKSHLEKEVTHKDSSMDDYFFGESFHLPENIGFSDEGVVFLYNVYEIASYNRGYTEFVIPFNEIDAFLKLE